ncbi:hypothetical protein PG990_002983 [Apiospora arundinis]
MEGNHLSTHVHRHVHGHGARHVHGLGPRIPTRPVEQLAVPLAQADAMPNLTDMMNDMSSPLMKRKDCESGDNSPECEKPVGSLTVPVSIAVVVPVVIALCVLLYLHRKTTRRHKLEDSDDKYKSMDFGADVGGGKGTKRKSTLFGGNAEKGLAPNHTKGLSMDMNLSSPYLLPPEIHQSRESLNSLAKSIHQHEDPYRHIASYTHSDAGSMRSFPRGPASTDRGSSIYTGKDRDSSFKPRPIATNLPTRQMSLPSAPLPQVPPAVQEPPRQPFAESDIPKSAPPSKSEFNFTDDGSALPQVPSPYVDMPVGNCRPHGTTVTASHGRSARNPRPGRKESKPVVSDVPSEYEDYAHQFQFSVGEDEPDTPEDRGRQASRPDEATPATGLNVPQKENKRLSVGVRPLPPDDFLSSEDPEFRANRIRSFYKEYFEDTKEDRPPVPALPQAQRAQYVEDYDAGYMGDAAFYDPDSNAFVMPYAEPVTRRAMTPPPSNRRPMPGGPNMRGPGGHGSFGPGPRGPPMGRPRAGSTMSAGPGRFGPASPRPGSSASARMGPKGPKKPLPPPSALSTLPTPAKLRDDSFLISDPIAFAPPPTFKDQQMGRSQSPLGERRPYALNVPIASPISSSFDEMAALPSPVRSMGSGISSMANSAIRNGAGRVSRLPGDQVFTTAAMEDQLKPNWGMRH